MEEITTATLRERPGCRQPLGWLAFIENGITICHRHGLQLVDAPLPLSERLKRYKASNRVEAQR